MWPMSTASMPKHFLPLVNDDSLFQINWRVLRKRFKPEEIFLQTNEIQAKIAKNQVPELRSENIFIEPETRNTGPATGLLAANLIRKGLGDEVFGIIQVDDLRLPEEAIFDLLELAEKYVKKTHKYVTGGFAPKWLQAGVDYLLMGQQLPDESKVKIFEIKDFVDRSEVEKLNSLMGTNDLLLHCNQTTTTGNDLLNLYKKYRMDWYTPLKNIVDGAKTDEEFAKMPKGMLEEVAQLSHRDGNSLVIEVPFEWIDFGTWEAVSKFYDERKVTPGVGGTLQLESDNNFLWSKSGKKIAVIGLSDIVVIESEEGILVSRKDKTGMVNKVTEKINSGDF
jgi:mannose-1-phosphate guanylyltransferase